MVYALTKLRIIGELPKLSGCTSLPMRQHSPHTLVLKKSSHLGKRKRKIILFLHFAGLVLTGKGLDRTFQAPPVCQ